MCAMAKKTAREERRKSPRVEASLAVELSAPGTGDAVQLLTESINISTGGVYCSVRSEVPLLTRVGLSIQLPRFAAHKGTQVLRCEGVIVRCEPARSAKQKDRRFDVACAFQHVDGETQDLINEYILWRTLTQGRA